MMEKIYTFKVKLMELEDVIWRDIEISSLESVAKLGYSVLAAFEAKASHLFCIKFNGNRYEILIEGIHNFDMEPVIDPIATKLKSLNLSIGDRLSLEYDFGADWEFIIELVSIEEMETGSDNHYPYITAGSGKGIIEDISPYELVRIKESTDKKGVGPKVFNIYSGKEVEWDYRQFDLENANRLFKDDIYKIQCAYEMYE